MMSVMMTVISIDSGMKKKLAIVYGSDSSEWEVAVRSGEFTASCFDAERYDVYEIFARFGDWHLVALRKDGGRTVFPENVRPQIDKTDFSLVLDGVRVKFDLVYIMQHGTPGENGLLQGYFEMIGMPYSGCDSFTSAVVFDKFSCKSYLRDLPWVKLPKDVFLRRGQSFDAASWVEKLGLPMFVKSTIGGSSFGVTKVKEISQLEKAVDDALKEGNAIIAEQAISGRELTCAVYRKPDGRAVALPIIEIVPHTEWFDYEAKYNGLSDEICPAPVSDEEKKLIEDTSVRIYDHLNCAGVVRVDYIMSADGLYFLEVNAIPGMTSASLVPKMVCQSGMSMKDFLNEVIDGKLHTNR